MSESPGGAAAEQAAAEFADLRPLLFTVAYEILGAAADAEDVVQESWLRWADVERAEVREPRAYLVRIVTRQALNRLRTLARRRETYVGPWLPEPLLTAPDVADDVALAESVSTAMLVVLESLTPDERVVFVLREVFGFEYAEIAAALDRTDASVRQLAHRAREHVAARRPRQAATPARVAQVTERFLLAAATGEMSDLLEVLAPDVVLTTDGGGLKQAALRPIYGVEKVVRFLNGIYRPHFRVEVAEVNGATALLFHDGEVLDTVVTWVTDDDRVTQLYAQRNPEKLAALAVRALAR